jgi:signal transduction histidine kinase
MRSGRRPPPWWAVDVGATGFDRGGEVDADRGIDGILAGWAHDLGKPLQVIESMAGRLVEDTAGDRGARRVAARIRAVCRDALRVVDRLVAAGPDGDRPVALASIVERAVCVAEGLHPGGCVRRIGPMPRVGIAEAGRLYSVLVNVVDNALRATPGRETVTIGARLHARACDRADELVIEVVDRGAGIRRERLESALSPASARPSADARGLGLLESRRQIAAMGGRMTFRSADGGGTRVTLCMPVSRTDAAARGEAVVSSAARR